MNNCLVQFGVPSSSAEGRNVFISEPVKMEEHLMKNQTEIWKDIEGFENYYQISNLGRVKSFRKRKPSILIATPNNYGYSVVSLHKQSKRSPKQVHRMVMEAFSTNPENKPQVNHIDENKTNNNVQNLEWVTRSENMMHGTCRERIQATRNKRKVFCAENPVYQIDLITGETIALFKSTREAGRQTKTDSSLIRRCCNGKAKFANGCKWKYKNNGEK